MLAPLREAPYAASVPTPASSSKQAIASSEAEVSQAQWNAYSSSDSAGSIRGPSENDGAKPAMKRIKRSSHSRWDRLGRGERVFC